jgi:hypothetical protein
MSEITLAVGASAEPRSTLSSTHCTTCNGRGLVGGFVSAESGYQDDQCPDCSTVVEGITPAVGTGGKT